MKNELRINELRAELKALSINSARVTERAVNELTAIDADRAYDEMLDEMGPLNIGCLSFDPSRVLRELDPIAYRCGFSDFTDSVEWEEIDGAYYERSEVETILEEEREKIESEIETLENEVI